VINLNSKLGPQLLFSVAVDENGKAYPEDAILVFPKHASANLPRSNKGLGGEEGPSEAKLRFMVRE
jgi:hypothetical protein